MAQEDKRQHGPDTAEAGVTVTGSGNATAASGGTAVTGYRGPAPRSDRSPDAPVHLSDTGDAIATAGAVANTGYIGALTMQQRAPQEPTPWPHQVGVIPPAARAFQRRAAAERLHTTVDGGGTAVLNQLLTGMGGVGKTQLAADYVRTAWNDGSEAGGLDVLVWVDASARSAIVTRYAQAGVELCRADPNDPDNAARSFLAWLTPKAGAKPCRWLIVLDDVADPDDLKGLWPPDSPHGRTLVTTRRRDAALAAQGRRTIEVGLFTEAEALTYLTASLTGHGHDESADELTALAKDLGRLPLALAQAAAYLIDTDESVAGYRELLADRATALADAAPDRLPDDQDLPLAAAWSLSIDRADTLKPVGLARPMLTLTAFLDANGIPQDVLTSAPALAHLTAHRTRTGPEHAGAPDPVSARDAVRALSALHRLSLVDHDRDASHRTVRVHQLIQRTTRDTLTPHQYDITARAAADALIAAWPTVERNTALAQTFRANTTALAGHAGQALYRPDAHAVLYRTGRSLGEAGQVIAARDHFQHLTETTCHHLGPDHPDTLTARNDLAEWRGEAGDAAGAADAFAELLDDRIRVLGPDHPNTLTTRGHLAQLRGRAGDAAGAADALADLLDDRIRVLGPDAPDTLTTRGNLAFWRGRAGDAAGAADALADLLDDRIRVLGPDAPGTLTTRGDLAFWRGEAGDAAGAADAFAELLSHVVRVLGPDAPGTLTTRGNLAFWRGEAGDAAGAADAFAELLPHVVRVLGPDAPDTLATRGNLAQWRGRAGDAAGAADALAELLDDRIRVLGPDAPGTLTTRGNLAFWRGEAGDAAGAADAFAELLPHVVRVLGPDATDTLAIRGNLAFWRGKAGDAAGAGDAYKQLHVARRRLMGENHPATLAAWGSFAHWRGQAGDAAGAVTVTEQLLEHMVRVLGADHPHVPIIRSNLAHWQKEAERVPGLSGNDRS
ncbi:tetratricopeptide repeat protein [Streptomyces pharetrae]|uniref:tetratricopeptide repeat protein n=1 Tax=Streptomyces pharetrae TaxID=291370 RepID=UPI00335EE20C